MFRAPDKQAIDLHNASSREVQLSRNLYPECISMSSSTTLLNSIVPDGTYIARLVHEHAYTGGVVVEFEITIGPYKCQRLNLPIATRKAVNAVRVRKAGWIEWMAFDGDVAATKVDTARREAIDGQIYVKVKGGVVKSVGAPNSSERVFLAFYSELSTEWILNYDRTGQANNLSVCQTFFRQTGRLPRADWPYFPKDAELAEWLFEVIEPKSPIYMPEANQWVNQIFDKIGGRRDLPPNEPWPKICLNTGFQKPPPALAHKLNRRHAYRARLRIRCRPTLKGLPVSRLAEPHLHYCKWNLHACLHAKQASRLKNINSC